MTEKALKPIKPFLNYEEQINNLIEQKGMIVNDHKFAVSQLEDISYFALIDGYKNLFYNPMTRKYKEGTTFEDLVALYEFDENLDFVLFRDHGKAIARPYYYFKKLMKKCNIDCTKHVWHDLRHTYATLLDQNNMNMKVVSEILGHYSEEFTNEVYVIHKPEVIIYDTSEVMNSFIESLKLDSTERTIPVYDISFIQEYLF